MILCILLLLLLTLADLSLFAVIDQKNHRILEQRTLFYRKQVQREGKFLTYISFCNHFVAEEGIKLESFKFLVVSQVLF